MARKDGNGDGDSDDEPAAGRRGTREDLTKAALEAASTAAHAAADTADAVLEALTETDTPAEGIRARRASAPPETSAVVVPRARTGSVPPGPGAKATGHGSAAFIGLRPATSERTAIDEFMARIEGNLKRAGRKLQVTETVGWIKIENVETGNKLYLARTKTAVTRVESTLDPDLISGAAAPDKPNGRIASWIPADPEIVGEAIDVLAGLKEHVRPPLRRGRPPSGRPPFGR